MFSFMIDSLDSFLSFFLKRQILLKLKLIARRLEAEKKRYKDAANMRNILQKKKTPRK